MSWIRLGTIVRLDYISLVNLVRLVGLGKLG